MRAEARRRTLASIRAALAAGTPLPYALLKAGVSEAWWQRWSSATDLQDAPRSGRPPRVTVSEADATTLRTHYLRSNRARNAGSMSATARYCAASGLLAPDLAAEILKPRADPASLPTAVLRVFRSISHAEFARYRDPRAGQGTNDGISIPGWLRMQDDGTPLDPGQRQVWDDASVNVGMVVPWTRGGDPCSEKYGVRVARFQLLLASDARTDCIVSYGLVMNPNDAYRANNCIHVMFNAWRTAGGAPREVVLEGGVWQSHKMQRFISQVGTRVISAKGRPRQKLVESVFNRLWTWLSLTLPPAGQIGRFRGEMQGETQDWLACRAGKKDPRTLFPSYTDFLAALQKAIDLHNAKPVKSRVYGCQWVPADLYAERPLHLNLPVSPELRYQTLPVDVPLTIQSNGILQTSQFDPHGYKHEYSFVTPDLYRYAGAKVRLMFDPLSITEGAAIFLARPFSGLAAGTLLNPAVPCISAAPSLGSHTGWLDARDSAKALKRASRALVTTAVRALDRRDQFAAPAALPQVAHPEPALISPISVPFSPDFAAARKRRIARAAMVADTNFEALVAGIQA